MWSKALLALSLLALAQPAFAQNTTCSDRPLSSNNNACANTAWVTAKIAATGSTLVVGTSPVTSGVSGRVLYDNAGVLGEYLITGSGQVVMQTSPTLITPNIGVATGTSLSVEAPDGSDSHLATRAHGTALITAGILASKSRGTAAAPTTIQADDKLAQFLAAGYNGGTSTYDVVGALGFYAIDTFSTGVNGSGARMALVRPGTFTEQIVQNWVGSGRSAIGLGNLTSPQAALTVTNNTTAGIVNTAVPFQSIGADGASAGFEGMSFGAASALNLTRANNTAAARAAIASGEVIGAIFGYGFDGSNYIAGAGFRFVANQTYSVGANGTRTIVLTTADGSASVSEGASFWGSKGMSVGPSGTADPGSGVVNAATGYRIANAATSGNVLRGNGTNFVSAALDAADLSGLGAGVATWLATPSSANLASAVTGETGSGALVFGTSPAITTPTGIVATDIVNTSIINYRVAGINFNSANTDNAFTFTPPSGYSRYQVFRGYISGCSASATTATFGVFTDAAGAGTAIVASGTAVTVSTASEATANNTQSMTIAAFGSGTTISGNDQSIFFRVQTPQGSAVTCTVTFQLHWIS